MSYILDALRKSDQQRQRGTTPTLQSAHAERVAQEPRSHWLYAVLVVALASGAFTVGLLRPWHSEAPIAKASTAVLPAANMPTAQHVAQVANGETSQEHVSQPAASAAREVMAKQTTDDGSIPTPIPTRDVVHESLRTAQVVARTHSAKVGEKPRPTLVKEQKARDEKTREERIPTLAELPASIRQDLPQMTITVHAYSHIPKDRLVGVNDKLLHEGESLTPELVLEKITPDGMIFNYKGTRFHRGVE